MPSTKQISNTMPVNQTVLAEKLNLSVSTVSKALRSRGDVNKQTLKKVQELADSLGYKPVKRAEDKSLQFVVALVNSSSFSASRSGYFEGLTAGSVSNNSPVICHYLSSSSAGSILEEKFQPPVIRNNQCNFCGFVLIHYWPEEVVVELAKRWSCVSIMHEYPASKADFVGVNSVQGISLLMDKLYEKGHRQIGFFGHSGVLSWSRARYSGYANSLCRLGLDFDPARVIEVEARYCEQEEVDWSRQYDKVAELVQQGVKAWMCPSDHAALRLYMGLSERGLKIPQDVAITGFDSGTGVGLSKINLTSVHVPSFEMGQAAVTLLAERRQNPELSRQVRKFDCEYVAGETI